MDVGDGKEKEYLEIENEWLEIHNYPAARGKILSWGLAKARKNDLGYEYVTWKTFRSLKDLEQTYDWEALGQWMGENKLNKLLEKHPKHEQLPGARF